MRRATVLALALVLSACGKDSSDSATTSTAAPSTTTTAFAGSASPVSTPVAGEVRELKAVRLGTHEAFDRVVFEFDGAVPGYSVKYVERPITADASGEEVNIAGDSVLEVRFEPATAHDTPRRSGIEAPVLVEAVKTGDFEAVAHYAIGVKSRAAFHAFTSERTKLVIDIAHG